MKAKATLLSLLTILSLILPIYLRSGEVQAASFSVAYDITFIFNEDGSARAVQKIALKNLTTDLYPSEYSLNIGPGNVTKIAGSDSLGAIQVRSLKDKDSTVLRAEINEKVIGKNKKTDLTLNYTIKNLASKKGRMWELLVPGINTSENLDSFRVKIEVPKKWGSVYSIYPSSTKKENVGSTQILTFDKKKNPAENIIASFGDYQVVEFSLSQKLKNPNFFAREGSILVPSDTQFQEIYFSQIQPRPDKFETDQDGNWGARYNLKAGEEKNVLIKGLARIDKTLAEKVPSPESENARGSLRFWEADSKEISEQAKKLQGPKEIYNFVLETLTFNKELAKEKLDKRDGAQGSLRSPDKALTSEFADLFIALARAKGIKARQLVGFAFGDGSDLTPTLVNGERGTDKLHSWVEYQDPGSSVWRQVDPAWGETRSVNYFDYFDSNHFSLFTRGENSENPKIPDTVFSAGSQGGTLEVKLVETDFNFVAQPKMEVDLNSVVSGFPSTGKLIIFNDSGKSLRAATLTFSPNSLKLIGEPTQNLGTILPFSQYVLNFKLRSGSLLSSDNGEVNALLSGFDQGNKKDFTVTKQVQIKPFFSLNLPQIILLIILIVTLAGLGAPFYKKFLRIVRETSDET
ncbi:MAG: transglutaminase domain-containing protein [Candidatus Woykebacteria bacterium]